MARYTYLHPDAIQDKSITKAKLADGAVPSVSGVNLGETDLTSDITLTEDQIAAFNDPDVVVYLVLSGSTYRVYLDPYGTDDSGNLVYRRNRWMDLGGDDSGYVLTFTIMTHIENGVLMCNTNMVTNIPESEINEICI